LINSDFSANYKEEASISEIVSILVGGEDQLIAAIAHADIHGAAHLK